MVCRLGNFDVVQTNGKVDISECTFIRSCRVIDYESQVSKAPLYELHG